MQFLLFIAHAKVRTVYKEPVNTCFYSNQSCYYLQTCQQNATKRDFRPSRTVLVRNYSNLL